MIRGPLGFGGASLPGLYTPIPAAQAHATVLHALASGVTHFDVAPRYGLGEAELGKRTEADGASNGGRFAFLRRKLWIHER